MAARPNRCVAIVVFVGKRAACHFGMPLNAKRPMGQTSDSNCVFFSSLFSIDFARFAFFFVDIGHYEQ